MPGSHAAQVQGALGCARGLRGGVLKVWGLTAQTTIPARASGGRGGQGLDGKALRSAARASVPGAPPPDLAGLVAWRISRR